MSPTIKRIRLSYKKKAKQKCLFFNQAKTRKRIYINALATYILKEIITNPELIINEGEAYSDNFFLSEAFDISDIKINNINIDTRCIINNDFTQLWIPKKPYEFGFVFDFYVAININTTSDKAEILGYVTHEDIKDVLKTNTDKINYYVFDTNKLKDISGLEKEIIELSKIKPPYATYKDSDHEIIQEMFTAFLDNTLSSKEKNFFNSHLTQCDLCREELLYLYLFDKKIKSQKNKALFIDPNAVLYEDPVLEIVKEYIPVDQFKKLDDQIKEAKPNLEKIEALKFFDKEESIEITSEETIFDEIPEEPILEEIKAFTPFEAVEEIETISEEPVLEEFDAFTPFDAVEEIETISEEPVLEEFDSFTPFEASEEIETISEEPILEEIDAYTPFDTVEEIETISEEPVLEEFDAFTPFDAVEETETISEEPVLEEFDAFTPFDAVEETKTISEEPVLEEFDAFTPFEAVEEIETISEEPILEEIDAYTPFDTVEEIETISEETISEDFEEFTPYEAIEEPYLEESFELITPDTIDITSEYDLLAEAKAAENFLNAEHSKADIEEPAFELDSPEESFTFEQEFSYQTPEETEIPPFFEEPVSLVEETPVSFIEETPVSTKEDEEFLTLENLEEEYVDTLYTFDDNLDLESIEKSTIIEEPSFESDFSDFTTFHEESTITSEPDTIKVEQDTFTDEFYFDTQKDETLLDTTEEIDSKLEDLEEEFNSLASFNFEEEPIIGIQPVENVAEEPIQPEEITIQEQPENVFDQQEIDIPEIEAMQPEETTIKIEPEDMFEIPEGLENMFDTPINTADPFSEITEDDSFVTIGDNEDLFEEIPVSEEFTTQQTPDELEYIPLEIVSTSRKPDKTTENTIQEQAEELEKEFEQQQEDIAPIDEATDSVIPTDTEIASLKEFAEKQKDSATNEVKKAKKGKNKKLILLAASLLLIGTVTAGVIIIAPSLSSLSNNMLSSAPKLDFESPSDKLKKELAEQRQQQEIEKKEDKIQTEPSSNTTEDNKEVTPHEIEQLQPPDTKKLLAQNTDKAKIEPKPAIQPPDTKQLLGKEQAETKPAIQNTPKQTIANTKKLEASKPSTSKLEQKAAALPPAPAQKAKPVEEPKPVIKPTPKVNSKNVVTPKAKTQAKKPVTAPSETSRLTKKRKSATNKQLIASNKPAYQKAKDSSKLIASSSIPEREEESPKGSSFLPEKDKSNLNDGYKAIQADTDTASKTRATNESLATIGRSAKAPAPANGLLAGLAEKKETIKQNLNPSVAVAEKVSYITSANVFWKPTTSKRIEAALKAFINTSTQKAKSAINASLKNNNISGQHNSIEIIIKINNSTNSITATTGSTSGSSRVDNLILNAVRQSFSAGSLPKSDNDSDIIKIKLIVALQH